MPGSGFFRPGQPHQALNLISEKTRMYYEECFELAKEEHRTLTHVPAWCVNLAAWKCEFLSLAYKQVWMIQLIVSRIIHRYFFVHVSPCHPLLEFHPRWRNQLGYVSYV